MAGRCSDPRACDGCMRWCGESRVGVVARGHAVDACMQWVHALVTACGGAHVGEWCCGANTTCRCGRDDMCLDLKPEAFCRSTRGLNAGVRPRVVAGRYKIPSIRAPSDVVVAGAFL